MKKIYLVLMAIFLASCSAQGQPAAATAKTAAPSAAPSAYPMETLDLSVPTPAYPIDTPTFEAVIRPTNDATKGQVFGKLTIAGKPVNNYAFYLAKVVTDNKGNEIVVNFSRDSSYPAQPDPDGRFEFVNVAPGRYGFVIDRIKDSVLLTTPGTDLTLLVTVLSGQSQNLGDLVYDQMPTNNP